MPDRAKSELAEVIVKAIERRGNRSQLLARAPDRGYAPHRAADRRRHRAAASGVRAGQAGGRHLRPHGSAAATGLSARAFKVLRHPESRRDHTRHEAPEAGSADDSDRGGAAGSRRAALFWRPHNERSRANSHSAWIGSHAGSGSPGAFACRSVFLPRRSICLSFGGARRMPAAIAVEPAAGAARSVAAGLRGGVCEKESRAHADRPLRTYVRNPLYLGSMLIAFGFALALLSWPVALVLAIGFLVIYVPVIASEERFLRATFPDFEAYCSRVPRTDSALTPAERPRQPLCTRGLATSPKCPPAASLLRSI